MGKFTMVLRTATRLGPLVYAGVKTVAVLMRENPELARYGQDLLDRFGRARTGHSRTERLRRSVALLRTQAETRLAEARDPDETLQAERWLAQAARLDDAIDLISIRRGRQRTRDAAAVEVRVEELFAEIFTAAIQHGASAGGTSTVEVVDPPRPTD